VIVGVGSTVKAAPLLATRPTVTTTFPLVAPEGTGTAILVSLQLVGDAGTPLNATVLVPCEAPKFAPLMLIEAPAGPAVGFRDVMLGPGAVTVKVTPLLAQMPVATTTLPVVAPFGTGATILVGLQLVGALLTPLKVTVLVPCYVPKLVPVIVTEVPSGPEVGFKLIIAGITVKFALLLAKPATVTVTGVLKTTPGKLGTGTTTLVLLQLVGVAAVVPKATVLEPWVAPKFVPVMVTVAPTAPVVGLRLVIAGVTMKFMPLLVKPPTVTTTLPLAAPGGTVTVIAGSLHEVDVAGVPLNVTVLVPCVDPKFEPVILTEVPSGPEVGLKLLILGVTVKTTPLLATPLTVTTTGPVVA